MKYDEIHALDALGLRNILVFLLFFVFFWDKKMKERNLYSYSRDLYCSFPFAINMLSAGVGSISIDVITQLPGNITIRTQLSHYHLDHQVVLRYLQKVRQFHHFLVINWGSRNWCMTSAQKKQHTWYIIIISYLYIIHVAEFSRNHTECLEDWR